MTSYMSLTIRYIVNIVKIDISLAASLVSVYLVGGNECNDHDSLCYRKGRDVRDYRSIGDAKILDCFQAKV